MDWSTGCKITICDGDGTIFAIHDLTYGAAAHALLELVGSEAITKNQLGLGAEGGNDAMVMFEDMANAFVMTARQAIQP